MRTHRLGSCALAGFVCLLFLFLAAIAQGQWVAFNDHVPNASASITHTNTTRLKIPVAPGPTTTNVLLKNIVNGTNLNVTLTITRSTVGLGYNLNGSQPSVGTPLRTTFDTFVDFGPATDCNVELFNAGGTTGTVTYAFTGLNPAKLYSFKGGAVRNSPSQTNRWTRIELQSADALTSAHTAGTLTLASNVAAANFGFNTTNGNMVDWESINPGADGTFLIVCTHFFSAGSTNNGTNGYAITGIRLEEIPTGPPLITVQPTNKTVYSGENATFSVSGAGKPPLTYQWYKNDFPIGGATGTNYTTDPTSSGDDDANFYVTVSNTSGTTTSSIVTLTVSNSPPILLTEPPDQTATAPDAATFSVTATGSKPLSFQWYRNNGIVSGATNASYTINSTTINDSGARFSVRVSNSFGSATSSNATLTVNVPPLIVVPYTNLWRYFTNGTDLGTAWQATNYDDSGWAEGRGWLGLENNAAIMPYINTDLPRLDAFGNAIRTFYFRTHFTLDYDPYSLVLVSSNYIDDGAVLYLNGHEIGRFNMADPPTPIDYRTLALTSVPEGVGAIFTNIVPADRLVQGDNVIAVELHQVNDTSSDNVFGMGLTAFFLPPTLLTITNNPTDQSVPEGTSTTFTVGFTGSSATIQWFKWINGSPVAIPGATRPVYTITNVSIGDASYYSVVLSNTVNSVTSTPAFLMVLEDRIGPRLLLADSVISSSDIVVTFSESVSASTATNIGNYLVTNVTSGGTLGTLSVIQQNGTNVILTTSPRSTGENYLLIVNNIRDTSPHQNLIAPNSRIPISTTVLLVGLDQPYWEFYNPVLGPPYEPYEPPTNWNQLDFVVPGDYWGRNVAGLFAYNPRQEPLPAPVNTLLSGGAISSFYRAGFGFSGSPVGATFFLRHVISDGAIAYLNGAEIYRYSMPTGLVNALTPGNATQGTFDSGSFPLPDLDIRCGSNVFAAELHGISSGDQNLAFGAELKAQILSWARGPVIITAGPADVTVPEGASATFRFVGIGASGVQWYANDVAIPGATQPVLKLDSVPISWDGLKISVLASNTSSMAMSTNARLHVIADTVAPALLGATLQGNSILLNFSEALLESSATNLANFLVTNAIGANVALSSVSLINPSNVLVTLSAQPAPAPLWVVLNDLKDKSAAQNEIAPNTTATPGFDVFIPIDTAWKYDQSGREPDPNWKQLNYNDAGWPAGAGLLYQEGATLPAPKNTVLSLVDSNGVQITTHYFRHRFLAYNSEGSMTVSLRHVVDDGVVLYVNGEEIHRFNMAGGPVMYSTLANVNVGDAVFAGPFQIVLTNLLIGENVLAAEVHQNPPSGNSDVVFGAELFAHVDPVITPGLLGPSLRIHTFGGNVVLSWPDQSFTLEFSDGLGPGADWQPVSNPSNPYFASPFAAPTRFYRLRK